MCYLNPCSQCPLYSYWCFISLLPAAGSRTAVMLKCCNQSPKALLQWCPLWHPRTWISTLGCFVVLKYTNLFPNNSWDVSDIGVHRTRFSSQHMMHALSVSTRFNITESMAFECVTQVCATILELEEQYIVWPSEQEQREEEALFCSNYGMCYKQSLLWGICFWLLFIFELSFMYHLHLIHQIVQLTIHLRHKLHRPMVQVQLLLALSTKWWQLELQFVPSSHAAYSSAIWVLLCATHMYIILGFPGVIGSIDGTEVTMMRPSINPEVYFNRKKIQPQPSAGCRLFPADHVLYCWVTRILSWRTHVQQIWKLSEYR